MNNGRQKRTRYQSLKEYHPSVDRDHTWHLMCNYAHWPVKHGLRKILNFLFCPMSHPNFTTMFTLDLVIGVAEKGKGHHCFCCLWWLWEQETARTTWPSRIRAICPRFQFSPNNSQQKDSFYNLGLLHFIMNFNDTPLFDLTTNYCYGSCSWAQNTQANSADIWREVVEWLTE